MQEYKYRPLGDEEIRLVTILPANSRAHPLQIHIEHIKFTEESVPKFDALSYSWGSPGATEIATVVPFKAGGQKLSNALAKLSLSHTTLKAWENLAGALRHLRRDDRPRVIWIDAICLNQEDLEEKSAQIWKMWEIYAYADRVVVWLGPGSPRSTLWMQTLRFLSKQLKFHVKSGVISAGGHCAPGCEEWWSSSQELPYDEEIWLAVLDVLARDWFTRVWIWQEIHLANDKAVMVCGDDRIPWMTFRLAIYCLGNKESPGPSERVASQKFRKALATCFNLANSNSTDGALSFLSKTRHSLCKEPKDRIYAFLECSKDGELLDIEPDYDETVAEVYTEFAVAIIKRYGSLRLLHQRDGQTLVGSSTWVPNWNAPPKTIGDLRGHAASIAFGRGGAVYLPDHDILHIRSVCCGKIETISDVAPLDLSGEDLMQYIRKWEPHEDAKSGHSEDSNLDAYLLVLLNYENYPWRTDGPDWQLSMNEYLRRTRRLADDGEVWKDKEDFYKLLRSHVSGRAFYTTQDGNYGLAPSNAKIGHEIHAVLGSEKLMIFRGSGNGRHTVVGHCNLIGFMYMEALLGPLPDEWGVQEVERHCHESNWCDLLIP